MATKIKPIEIAGAAQAKRAAFALQETATGLVAMIAAIEEHAEQQIAEHRELMQKHLERKDLRPKVNFKPLRNNNWLVVLGTTLYYLGPKPNFAELDEDEPRFYWHESMKESHDAFSLFQCLIGVIQDYCNADV